MMGSRCGSIGEEAELAGEKGVAAETGGMVPDNGVDDEFVNFEGGSHLLQVRANASRSAYKIAGPLPFFGRCIAEDAEFAGGILG